jgi:hypothetical protein
MEKSVYMFVMFSILAFHGNLKVVEPVFFVNHLTLVECVDMLKEASRRLGDSYELRCTKLKESV